MLRAYGPPRLAADLTRVALSSCHPTDGNPPGPPSHGRSHGEPAGRRLHPRAQTGGTGTEQSRPPPPPPRVRRASRCDVHRLDRRRRGDRDPVGGVGRAVTPTPSPQPTSAAVVTASETATVAPSVQASTAAAPTTTSAAPTADTPLPGPTAAAEPPGDAGTPAEPSDSAAQPATDNLSAQDKAKALLVAGADMGPGWVAAEVPAEEDKHEQGDLCGTVAAVSAGCCSRYSPT
jgi:hypothetical protein